MRPQQRVSSPSSCNVLAEVRKGAKIPWMLREIKERSSDGRVFCIAQLAQTLVLRRVHAVIVLHARQRSAEDSTIWPVPRNCQETGVAPWITTDNAYLVGWILQVVDTIGDLHGSQRNSSSVL
jgi:hypothetical protein